MREIKFRVLLDRTKYDSSYKHWFYSDEMGLGEFFLMVAKNNLDAQEYTGLKDKNGREIYEGDIVKGWNDILYTVAYQSSSGKYDCCDFKAWKKGYYDAYLDLCDIGQVGPGECHPLPCIPTPQFNNAEVIGNIYENPELLGEKLENGEE